MKMREWDMRNPFKYGFDPNNYGWIVPLVGIIDETEAKEEQSEPDPEAKSEPKPSKQQPPPSKPPVPEPKPAPPPITAPSKQPEPKPAPEPKPPPSKPPAPPPSTTPTAPPLPPIIPTAPSPAVVEAQRLLREAQEAEARARKEEEEKQMIAEEKQRIAEENQRIADADRLRIQEENKRNEEAARLLAEELEREKEAARVENERKIQEYLTARQKAADARILAELNAAEEERKKKVAEAEQARQLELEKEKKDAAERVRLHEFALQRLLAEKEQNKIAQEAAALAEKARQEAAALEVVRQTELKKREEELRLAQEQAAADQAERDRMAIQHKLIREPANEFDGKTIKEMQAQMEKRKEFIDQQNKMIGPNLKDSSLARENWAPGEGEKVKLPPLVATKPSAEKAALEKKRLEDEAKLRASQVRAIERNRAAKGLPEFDPNSEYKAKPDVNKKRGGGTRRLKQKETKNHKVYMKRTKRRVPKYTRKLAVHKLAVHKLAVHKLTHLSLPHVRLPYIS